MHKTTAVFVLYAISAMIGVLSILFSLINIWMLIVLIILTFVSFYLFGTYLEKIDIYKGVEQDASITRKKEKRDKPYSMAIRKALEVLIDTILICVSYFTAYLLRFDGTIIDGTLELFVNTLPLVIIIKIVALYLFGAYRAIWKFVSIREILDIAKAITISFLLAIVSITFLYRFIGYSRAVFVIDWLLSLFLISGTRVFARILHEIFIPFSNTKGKRILIYGAGDAGNMLLTEIKNNKNLDYNPIGFLDDDLLKTGSTITGLPVLGTREDIPSIVEKHQIEEVVIAIFTIAKEELDNISEICKKSGITSRVISRIMS
jgi:UDP-GlcNAc:undecaprenyl-phosphate GlcNAc-1-phosphate transferase